MFKKFVYFVVLYYTVLILCICLNWSLLLKDELTTPQPENTDTSYLETATRTYSTSLNETTSIASIVSEKIGSKGIVLRYLSKRCEWNIHVHFIPFKKPEKRPIPQELPDTDTCSSYQGFLWKSIPFLSVSLCSCLCYQVQ